MFLYLSPPAGYAAFFSTIWPFIRSMVTLSAEPAAFEKHAWVFPAQALAKAAEHG